MLTVCVLLPLLVGGSIVLIKSLHPPKNIMQEILRQQATILPAIPQFFRALAHAPVPAGSAAAHLHQRRGAAAGARSCASSTPAIPSR